MKERPIIFGAESVRAILAGRKTQTRRAIRRDLPIDFVGGQDQRDDLSAWGYWVDDEYGRWAVLQRGLDQRYAHGCFSIPCPYGVSGDRLWVRETWSVSGNGPFYRADTMQPETVHYSWRSPIHMPWVFSRLTLEITAVRVQRLQDISEEDAKAEGVDRIVAKVPTYWDAFQYVWDDINGMRAPWESNPWVWALTFRRLK